MLSRFIATHSRHLRHLSVSLSPHFHPSSTPTFPAPRTPNCHSSSFIVRLFSSNQDGSNNNGGKPTSDFWKIGSEKSDLDDVFGTHDGDLTESNAKVEKESKFSQEQSGVVAKNENEGDESLFDKFGDQKSVRAGDEWSPMADFQPWKLGAEEKIEDLFGFEVLSGEGKRVEDSGEGIEEEDEMVKAAKKLELQKEEQALMEVLKGPNRAFGDLVAVSGITDAMLDSLIALKNFEDIDGLPPLSQIEDERYAKSQRKSSRYEIELQKQEEAAKARVRQVDEKGRAYGTGRRKCSIARVWIQPGEGKFSINEKEFDVYFPMLDLRAALLRPFSETKTLGLWDVKCTVKGGGVSGQVGAIRLGISRALQCWEPGLRPPLRDAGFLTRDPRVVERKKPGKAKARKSFQWVKR